jgi:hypothetical protein
MITPTRFTSSIRHIFLVMICGYPSELYEDALKGWDRRTTMARRRCTLADDLPDAARVTQRPAASRQPQVSLLAGPHRGPQVGVAIDQTR